MIDNDKQNQNFTSIFNKKPNGILFDKDTHIPLKNIS